MGKRRSLRIARRRVRGFRYAHVRDYERVSNAILAERAGR